MDPKSQKPLRLLVNPLTIWTDLTLQTVQAIWASAHAAAVRSNTAKVAVIPPAGAPAPNVKEAAKPAQQKPASVHAEAANAPRKARAPVREASKAVRSKAPRAKLRSKAKANAKRRATR
jgi:hypothetical protein